MIPRIASIFFVLIFLLSTADLRAQQNLIKRNVEECATAILQEKFDRLIDLTYPRVVQMMGGREVMLKHFRKAYSEMKTQGFTFDSIDVRVPIRIVPVKHQNFAVVSYLLVMKTPKGRLFKDATMLGVSEDKGKSWTFIDVPEEQDKMLALLFPDVKNLSKLLSLPPWSPPRYKK